MNTALYRVGDFVVYNGSIAEFSGKKAAIVDRKQQPANKPYLYRYALMFKGREVVEHVRPTSFEVIPRADVPESLRVWGNDWNEQWEGKNCSMCQNPVPGMPGHDNCLGKGKAGHSRFHCTNDNCF